MNEEITEIVEGSTKLLVPKGSMTDTIPPKEPAFFNPRASLSRDLSIIACSAFWKDFKFPKIFFDGLSGLGARGLRVANEVKDTEKVIINDVNAKALEIALKSAEINNLKILRFLKMRHVDFLVHVLEKIQEHLLWILTHLVHHQDTLIVQ